MSSVSEPAAAQPGNPELPTVSAVIPAYNAADTIERALNSVYAQTYENIIEVIVVDDGSTDDTAQIIRDKFPDVILIQQENGGNAAARNTGIAAATGEYLAFLDADDEWLPEKTEVQVTVVKRHFMLDLLMTSVVDPECQQPAVGRSGGTHVVTELGFRTILRRAMPDRVAFCCSSWLIRRVVMAEHQFEAGRKRAVDWEFLLRLTGQGHQVAALLAPLYRYHVLSSSVSNSTNGRLELCRLDIEIIRRYDPAGNGWHSELLPPEEFRRVLHSSYYSLAWRALELGDRTMTREYLSEAADLAPGSALSKLRHRFAAWQPDLYRTLSRMCGH